MLTWVRDPHAEKGIQERTTQRILAYAEAHYAGTYTRLNIRFRSQFCYIDAYTEPAVSHDFPPPDFPETREAYIARMRSIPTHLCRLRYFGDEEGWTFSFYTYSHEQYEPCVLDNGTLMAPLKKRLPPRLCTSKIKADVRGTHTK